VANPIRRVVDRLLAGAVEKALPDLGNVRGAVHDIGQQVAAMREAQTLGAGAATPLPRPPAWASAPFGPGSPLYPAPLDPVRPDSGRPAPRLYEYPVSWNLTGTANRLHSWQLLRDAADGLSLFRRCIEIRKDHMTGLDWDIVISQGAIETAQRDEGPGTGRADLEGRLRDRLSPEIDRAAAFIGEPDRANGYSFAQWLSMLLEEVFVLDAAAIYPRRTYGGDLWSLEVLDGSTIKPLLDERGGRPLAPAPAFQQILYGFPRGEFTADVSTSPDGAEVIDGAYASDQLIYSRRVVRVWTPYGYSAVEQALDDGDLYLKRHRWMKSEYTEGTSVGGLFKIDAASTTGSTWSPEQVLQYERAYNDAVRGSQADRQAVRFLPPGVEPVDGASLTAMAEKYKPEYDLHLIKLLASHFDTTLPELGFTEAKGLGSEGYHEGQADVQARKTRPIIKYVQSLLTAILRTHAGMPRELEFKFLGLDEEDDPGADDVEGKRQAYGVKTLNERRDDLGLPRYDFEEADKPMIITGRGVVFLEGSSALEPPGVEVDPPKPPPVTGQPGEPQIQEPGDKPAEGAPAPDKKPPADDKAKAAELTAYRKWSAKRRSPGGRPFRFQHHTAGELLSGGHVSVNDVRGNKLAFGNADPPNLPPFVVKAGDADPKAPAPPGRQWPGWEHDLRVVEHYAPLLSRALSQALTGPTSATALARTWLASRTEATDLGAADARAWLEQQGIDLETPLRRVLEPLWTEGYFIGDRAAAAMVAGLLLARKAADPHAFDVAADWSGWTPGDARAAALILDAEGRAGGLIDLLDAAGVDITSIAMHRLDDLAQVLHRSLAEGWSNGKLAKALRGVLEDPRYARMVATTETNRAVSAASLARYRDNQIEAKEWMSAEDQRVCKICNENEGDGPVALDAYFSSGDDAPPGHPDCRCAIAPALADRSQLEAAGGVDLLPPGLGDAEALGAEELAGDLGDLAETEAADETGDLLAEFEAEVADLAAAIDEGIAEESGRLGGSMGVVTRITLQDGRVAIRKVVKDLGEGIEIDQQRDAEQLTAIVGRAFGFETPTVLVDGQQLFMSFVDGTLAADLPDEGAAILAGPGGVRLRLFDLLTSGNDRNEGNWFVDPAGRIRPIDHGMSFQPWSAPDEVPSWRADRLEPFAQGGHWVANPLTAHDVQYLRHTLAETRPAFERADRLDWYRAMMSRLEVLAEHASGTEDLLS
jgi:SPP1 gp7 family putative phage head morphogenesis protein